MKNTIGPILAVLSGAICSAPAANMMINLHTDGTGAVSGASNLTLSPGHDTGAIGAGETTWNNVNVTTTTSSLFYSDGTAATGVTLSFGSESSSTADSIDYSTTATINITALDGTGGGGIGTTYLMSSPDSVYGNGTTTSNTAPGRAGWLGNASGSNDGLGLRLDGLAAGDYTIFAMGRNTNSSTATSMDFFSGVGASSGTFDYSGITAVTEANSEVPNTNPTGHDAFVAGDNYVAFNVTLASGESLFLASDGNSSDSELRGFLNMVQVVSVPEPSTSLLALGAAGLLLFRRRR